MAKHKKKKSNIPRHKRLKRTGRLQAAQHWIPKYNGENLVNGYSKHFNVNKLCAVKELEMIGYTYEKAYIQKLKDSEIQKQQESEKRNAAKKKKRKQPEEDFWDEECDETYAFIAGYTSGGAPYGITWEEWEEEVNTQSPNKT
ncbi:hypothetical protein QGM71_05370 [Virgibacillus sp. C22-A2]|uniref:Uncharacterized protein n=1 Tax=Virgibacillus tibetensis TaxID=3042313 RepID=A0ABU6KEP8_9BACI|nr:hypothetical protein [Virgibacillus sp. C22-A2]